MSTNNMTTVERLRALYEAGTKGPLTLMRYEHGGGRLYKEEPRTLVADFYHEADRELLTAMHHHLPQLLAVVEAAEVAAKQGHVDTCAVRLLSSAGLTIPGCTCGLAALRTALHHLNAGKKEE